MSTPTRSPRRPVYVSGHRNPDTDSIGAAIAYAELKGLLDPETDHVPVRLGDCNAQTTWVLERAGVPAPRLLAHVGLRVREVLRTDFPVVEQDTPVRVAGRLMMSNGLELLPVVDGRGRLAGVLTERALARRYVRETHEVPHLLAPTLVATMAEALDGEVVAGPDDVRLDGRVSVLARALSSSLPGVSEGDVAVVGDRHDAQLLALERGISALVLSSDAPASDDVRARADAAGIPVIVTALDSYVAARLITLSGPASALAEDDPLTLGLDDLLGEVADAVKDAPYRAGVVVDRDGAPVGIVTRADLVAPRARRVMLVDHSEPAQSVPGIEAAEVVEILDHHHIGSVETTQPISATFDPVGSTCTLIAERFAAAGHEATTGAATLMLAALLSDTVVLTSPTTTDRDHAQAAALGAQLGVDPEAFGREMFEASSDVSGLDADAILGRDLKAYDLAGGQTLAIGQVETVGSAVLARAGELRDAAQARVEAGGQRLIALMVTDVTAGDTHLVVAGDVAMAERAFGASAEDGVIALPGVMSRKKQVAPPLLHAS